MAKNETDRREFMQAITGLAITTRQPAAASTSRPAGRVTGVPERQNKGVSPRIRFAVIGVNHAHINSQVTAVVRGGGEFVSFYAQEPDLAADFGKRFPQAKPARSESEILEDRSIHLVLSSIIPDQRAPLGIRVMQHGKDYMADKPGMTTLEQLAEVRRVQAQTRRIFSIMYSERFENRAKSSLKCPFPKT